MNKQEEQKKNRPLLTRLLWFLLTPTLIHGVIIGVSATLLVYAMVTLEITKASMSVFVGGALLLILGYFVGSYFSKKKSSPAESTDENSVRSNEWKLRRRTRPNSLTEESLAVVQQLKGSIDSQRVVGYGSRFLALMGLVSFMGITVSFAIFVATFMQVERLSTQNKLIETQNQLSEASRRASLITELTSILNEIDEEIDATGESKLESDSFRLTSRLEGRVVALSRTLRAYQFLDSDHDGGLVELALSPERAQLLISLLTSGVNLERIREAGDFSRSDLRRSDLRGANLKDIQLFGADLHGAELGVGFLGELGAIHDHTGGATLDKNSEARRTNLESADLRNANLSKAVLSKVLMSHARLDDTKLIGADLSDAVLIDADFVDANLSSSREKTTLLINADLTGANFSKAGLRGALIGNNILSNTKFDDADFEGAIVDVTFIDYLKEQNYFVGWTLTTEIENGSSKEIIRITRKDKS